MHLLGDILLSNHRWKGEDGTGGLETEIILLLLLHLKCDELLQGLHLAYMKILIVELIHPVIDLDADQICVQTNGRTHG